MERKKTIPIKIGNKVLGGNHKILIQSMSTHRPKDFEACLKEIQELEYSGCDIVRVAVLDNEDVEALSKLKEKISIPLVADIHFNYELGIGSILNHVDAVRINPGNIGKDENLEKLIQMAKEKHIPIRIGVNSGSIDPKFIHENKSLVDKGIDSLKYYVSKIESYGFKDLVLSIKMSSVDETIEAYEKASSIFDYPLHIGLTEAGIGAKAIVKSTIALSTLLKEGIGDTIRVSLTGDPVQEVIVGKEILKDLNLIDGPDLISCPTCGRTEVDLVKYADEISNILNKTSKKIKVAVMGCLVNGPGEAREADMGVAFITGKGVFFKKGKTVFTGTPNEAIKLLEEEIIKF